MNYEGKKILILEGYARQCLPFMRSFKKLGCEVTLLCNSKIDLGYASKLPDYKILGICDPDRYKESERFVCDLIKTGNYDLVVPLVDFSARILSENKEELSKYAVIASNDEVAFTQSQDKLEVMKTCIANGIPCPITLIDVEKAKDIIGLKYPIVVKPRRGCGAKGFHRVENEEELNTLSENFKDCVVQECIPQSDRNISVNLFIDNNGDIKSIFTYRSTRFYPLKGGTGTFNQLVSRPVAEKDCIRLAKIMNLRGWIGVDLIEDPRDKTAKVIEINPRILACAKIGFDAGIDMGLMILQKEFGEEVIEQNPKNENVNVRMSQTDILWFLKSWDRFKCKPSWFSHKNTKDQTFSWDDPLPWFAFLFRGLSRLKTEEEKRS